MALTLDCVCSDAGAYICEITRMYWVITRLDISDLPFGSVVLDAGVSGPFGITAAAEGEVELTPVADWLAAWDDLRITFSATGGSSSDDITTGSASWHFRAVFSCTDPDDNSGEQEQRFNNHDTATDICQNNPPAIDAVGSIGVGGCSGYIRHTRPLNDCNGFSVSSGDFSPKPATVQTVDISSTPPEALRLCPSGGSSPYLFGVKSGNLPGGMELDKDTGEITGSPDGSLPGSEEIVFFAVDAGHDYAEVTCVFLLDCSTTEEFGNVFY